MMLRSLECRTRFAHNTHNAQSRCRVVLLDAWDSRPFGTTVPIFASALSVFAFTSNLTPVSTSTAPDPLTSLTSRKSARFRSAERSDRIARTDTSGARRLAGTAAITSEPLTRALRGTVTFALRTEKHVVASALAVTVVQDLRDRRRLERRLDLRAAGDNGSNGTGRRRIDDGVGSARRNASTVSIINSTAGVAAGDGSRKTMTKGGLVGRKLMKVLLFATIKMTIGIGFGFHAERAVNVETCVRRDGQRRTKRVGGR